MFFKRICLLLPATAVMSACLAQAEELEPFNDYTPPPLLFDDPGAKVEEKPAGFLTAIEPEKEPDKSPPPVKKPTAPEKAKSSVKKKTKTASPKAPAKPTVKKLTAAPVEAVERSGPLEGNLVNPNARDILASIEGVKPPKGDGKGKVSLSYLPGETSLTLDMKNILLTNSLPAIRKQKNSRIEIHAYALPGKKGTVEAKRVSLARALETRDFLVAAGVDAARINIMPLGDTGENAGADRVDVLVAKKSP